MDITTLGLAIDSRQAATAAQNLDKLADAGARAETTTGKVTAAMSGDFKRLAKDVAALVETQTRQERMSQAAATAMLEMSASMRAVAANTAAASKAVDAEAIAAASARGAVAALTQALQANSDAQRKAESSARAEAAAQQAASAAAKDAATLRDSHVQAYRAQQTAADKYMASLRQEVGEFGKTRAEVEALRSAQLGLTAEQQRSAVAMGAQIDAMRVQQSQAGILAQAMAAIGTVMATAFVVERVHAVSKALFDASAAGERLRTTLDFASGGQGGREMAYVTAMADKLGLQLSTTAKAYASMAAAARGTSLEGEGARRVFEAVSKASAVMGLSADQSSGALLALQQMISKGSVQSEELRGQLGERLPGAFQIAARAMGITTAELGKLLETGQVAAADFLPKFAAQLESELGGAADKAAARLDAAVNKFDNAWERLKRAVGDAGVANAYAATASRAAEGLNAVSDSIERATKSKGFSTWLESLLWSQKNLNAEIANARKELTDLQAKGGENSPNIYLKSATADARAYLSELEAIARRQKELRGDIGGGAGRGSINPKTAAQMDAERQAREAELKAYFEKDIRQTREQKITEEIGKAREANAKMLAKFAGDEAAQTKIRAALEVEIANIREKHKPKGVAGAGAAMRDEVNAEIAEFQRGQQVQEEISRRTVANITAARAAGAMEEIDYIKAVAAEEISRMQAGETALQMQIDAASRKANSATQVAQLEGQLALQREKMLTREQQLQNDLAAVERKRAEQSRVLHNAAITQATQELAAMVAANKQTELDIEAIGLNDRQLQALNETRMDSVIERQREKIAAMEMLDVSEESADLLEIERQKLEQLTKARNLYTSKENRTRAVQEEQRAYTQMWESVDRTAHDVFVNVADDGMNAFERIGKTLKASILDMLYQMTIRRWMINIGASVFGAGFAGAAGAAGAAGGMGSIGMLGSLASSPFGATAMGWLGGMGGFGAGMASAASEAALGSAFVGPSVSAAGGAIGAGATFAQALPYLGLAIGALSLLGSFDKSGTPHYGASATYEGGKVSGDQASFLANRGISGRYSASAQAGVNAVAMGAGAALDALDKVFGGKGGFSVTTAYSDDSSDDPGFGSLRIGRNGQKVVDWGDTRTSKWADRIFADGEEGARMYAAAVAKDVRDAMLGIDTPEWARKLLTDIGDNVSMEQLGQVIQQIGVIKDTFETLGHTLTGFADLTDAARMAIMDAAGGIEALAASAGTFYQNFYTEQERTDIAKKQVRAQLDALGVDISLEDPQARAKYRALVESQLANIDKEGAPELYAALLKLSGAFAAVTDAADEATDAAKRQTAEQARRTAYDNLRRVIDRDRKDLQAQATTISSTISAIASAVDALKSNARDLYGEVDSTRQMFAAQGMVYIERALAGVRAGASVADYGGLSDAIGAARGGISSGAYVSEFERQRDTLVLAGQLSELGDLGDAQLSVEERQLRVINEQIEYLDKLAQQADELVNGTVALTGTVDSYFAQLIALLTPDKGDGGGAGGSGDGGGKFGIGGSGPGESAGGVGGAGETPDEEIRRYFKDTDISDAQSMRNARNTALFMGWTQEDIARAYDVDPADLRKLFEDYDIPAFAGGGTHGGGLRLVGEHTPELEATGPSRIYNAEQMGRMLRDNSDVVAELQAVQELLAEMRKISIITASNTAPLPTMADQWDNVTEGGNAMRSNTMGALELRI